MIQGDPTVTLLNTQPLLARLGVKGIATLRFIPQIVPVAVVDGSIQAFGLQLLDVPFTAGESTAPAANTRLANTGALIAGQYNLTIVITAQEANDFRLRRRNAADAADVWAQRFRNPAGSSITLTLRVNLLVNEFVVVENVTAGSAGIVYQASIWVQGPF